MHLIAIDDQVRDWSLSIGAIHRNSKSVAATSGSIAARKSLLNVMDVVFQKFYKGARSAHVDAQRREPMFSRMEVANFETLDSYVTLVVNGQNALSGSRSEMRGVQDRSLAGIAFNGNETFARVSRYVDAY